MRKDILNKHIRQLGSHGSAVVNTVRQLAGAIGTALVVTIYTAQVTNHLSEIMNEDPTASTGKIESLSSILGSGDAYFFMMLLAVAALLLTLFMPKKRV